MKKVGVAILGLGVVGAELTISLHKTRNTSKRHKG